MTSRTFHILQNAIYLLVIGVLCGMIHRPYYALDGMFREYYVKQEVQKKEQVKNMIAYVDWHMQEPGMYEKVKPYYNRILFVDSLTNDMISFLKEDRTMWMAPDSLKGKVDNYFFTLLAQVPSDSAAMSPFIDNHMSGYFKLDGKPNWISNILKNQPIAKKELLFGMLRYTIYNSEAMVVKKLAELSHGHGDYYDSFGIVTFTTNRLLNVDEKVSGAIVLAALIGHRQVEYFVENGLLENGQRLGAIFTDTAHDVGDYTQKGYLRWYKDFGVSERSGWDTLPWSFQYRVIAKGASIVCSNQICYRNVVNPLSVVIPGYAGDKIRLWAKDATVVNNNNGTGSITITDKRVDKVIVYADATDKRGHTATVHAMQFAVRDVPAPTLLINGKQATAITLAELQKATILTAQPVDDDWPESYTIAGYDACVIAADGKLVGDYKVKGNVLGSGNAAFAAVCKSLGAGARIYLSGINAKTKAGVNVSLPPVGLLVE